MLATESCVIFDMRGLALHALYMNRDRSGPAGSDGKPTPLAGDGLSALLQNYLLIAMQGIPPRNMYAVWDGGNNFRKVVYPGYKKKRHETQQAEPEPVKKELTKYMGAVTKLLKSLGICQVTVNGVEADDMVALMAEKIVGQKIIYTVDADLAVLAQREDTQVVIREALVENTINNVPLSLLTLYKSIVGDGSDEYIGVSGIGKKTFHEMLDQYGVEGMQQIEACVRDSNFELIHSWHSQQPNNFLQALIDKSSEWKQGYTLAQLHPNLCYQGGDRVTRPEWVGGLPDRDKVQKILTDFGCEDLMQYLEAVLPVRALVTSDNQEEWLAFFRSWIPHSPYIAFDYETYDELNHSGFAQASRRKDYVDLLSQRVVGCSFTFGNNLQYTIYVSTRHEGTNNVELEVPGQLIQEIQAHGKLMVAHNAEFENVVTERNFGAPAGLLADTGVACSYVDEEELAGLKNLSLTTFGVRQKTYKQFLEDLGVQNMLWATGEQTLGYGCDDAFLSAWHFNLQTSILQLEGTYDFYMEQERRVLEPLSDSFRDGFPIDYETLQVLEVEDKKIMVDTMERIRASLAQHCAEPSTDRAVPLFNDRWSVMLGNLNKKSAGEDVVHQKYNELWEKTWNQTRYSPYVVTTTPFDFNGTKTDLEKFRKAWDEDLTPFDGNTINKLNAWMQQNEDALMAKGDEGTMFTKLLAEAADTLSVKKRRSGEKYDRFVTFCKEKMAGKSDKTQAHGDELNFDSAPQMQELLFAKLGLPIRMENKVKEGSERELLELGGSPSAGKRAIDAALVHDVGLDDWRRPLLNDVVTYKVSHQNCKLFHTPYPHWKHPTTGLIHPGLRQCGTKTRRPSGTSPNMLQVSTKEGGRIRRAYTTKDGQVCAKIDINGQELRIVGSESKDPAFLDAYLGAVRKDIHSMTASAIAPIMLQNKYPEHYTAACPTGVLPYETFVQLRKTEGWSEVMEEIRKAAKAINFLLCYVGGASTLAVSLNTILPIAKQFMEQTFATYARLRPWQQEVIEFGRTHGYVLTAYGNRRHATDDLFSPDDGKRSRIERQLVNYTIQGCAADMLKVTLAECQRRGVFRHFQTQALRPVYDEVTVNCPIPAVVEYVMTMKEIMEIAPPGHPIPMEIEVSLGHNWGDLIEVPIVEPNAIQTVLEQLQETPAVAA